MKILNLKNVFSLLWILNSSLVFAQIPNPSFEDSSYAKYPVSPMEWNTPNLLYTDLSDPANSYFDLYNDQDGSNPVNFISDTSTLDFDEAKGFEINGRPDSLIVWMTYDIPSGDTLIIRTKNRETQNPFGYGEMRITGSEYEMTRYALKINYTSPGFADSGVIQAYVTDHTTDEQTVSFESMEFINVFGQPMGIIPNSKFNDWNMDSMVTPIGWIGLTYASKIDQTFSQGIFESYTADASHGNKAMVLETKEEDGDLYSGVLIPISPDDVLTYDGDIEDPLPMFPVSKRYESLLGDYKLVATAADTAIVSVAMFSNGAVIAKKDILLLNSSGSSYEGFEIHMDYDTFTSIPDSSSIFIYAIKGDAGSVGVKLFVDNLRFAETSSIENILPEDISIYPNPVQGVLNIESKKTNVEEVQILNMQGRIVKRVKTKLGGELSTVLDLSSLPQGIYTVGLYTISKTYYHKISLVK